MTAQHDDLKSVAQFHPNTLKPTDIYFDGSMKMIQE